MCINQYYRNMCLLLKYNFKLKKEMHLYPNKNAASFLKTKVK